MSKFDYDIFYGGTDDLGVSKEKYTKEEAIKTVEERKRGHWDGGGAYYCSNCNAYSATDVFGGGLDITEQHYCYNCGAIMDGQAICDD